jgi:hypothetical protein
VKLTNPETIQESEKEFIDTINAELDWDTIETLLLEKHQFAIQDEIDYKEGNLIVHNNQIAYKFDFEIKVPLSVIFNRQGECLEISTSRDDEEEEKTGLTQENDELQADDELQETDELQADDELQENDERENDISEEAFSLKSKGDEKVGQMASEIADMISEINQGDE